MDTRVIAKTNVIDLKEDKQMRLDVIEAILLKDSQYACGNVDYYRTKSRIKIFDRTHNTFYADDLAITFSAFGGYFDYNKETGKVEYVLR